MAPTPQSASSVDEKAAQSPSPSAVVLQFLAAMQAGDPAAVISLVAEDIVYTNVSLPTIRGKERFARGVQSFYGHHLGFAVVVHHIAENGSMVLTERTDAIYVGPFRMQFWVCGTFEVSDGSITLWRDYFDWRATTVASIRGLLGMIVPSLRAKFPDQK